MNAQVVLWAGFTGAFKVPLAGGAAVSLPVLATALDDAQLFSSDESGISATPVEGGSPTLLTSEHANVMVLDDTHVYFLHKTSNVSQGKVMRVAKTGGPAQILASSQYAPKDLVVDATHVYFSRWDGYIMRVPKQGGTVETFAAGQLTKELAVDATHVYWITGCPAIMKKSK